MRRYNRDLHFKYNPQFGSDKFKLFGGFTEHFKREKQVYIASENEFIYNVDFPSCFPTIICENNIGFETRFTSEEIRGFNAKRFKAVVLDGGRKFYIDQHASPSYISVAQSEIMKKRSKYKEEGKKEKAEAMKLVGNIIYGILGMQSAYNPLQDLISNQMITYFSREQLKSLLKFHRDADDEILLAQTDGCFVKTRKTLDEMKDFLVEYSKKTGYQIPAIKPQVYTSFLRLGAESYVALEKGREAEVLELSGGGGEDDDDDDMNDSWLEKKGAITKLMCPLQKKLRNELFQDMLLFGEQLGLQQCSFIIGKCLLECTQKMNLFVPSSGLTMTFNREIRVRDEIRLAKKACVSLMLIIRPADENFIYELVDFLFERDIEKRLVTMDVGKFPVE